MRPVTRAQLPTIRRRHRGYVLLLLSEALLVAVLPFCRWWPLLFPLALALLCLVVMGFLARFSPLRSTLPIVYLLGGSALVLEVMWRVVYPAQPGLGLQLNVLHLMVWILFTGLMLGRLVRTLTLEPIVTVAVVMGATAGYLLIGVCGGLMLTTLWLFEPGAFLPHAVAPPIPSAVPAATAAPSLMAIAFTMLTTVGDSVLHTSNVPGQVILTAISVVGQLYVAILIGLILGRFRGSGRFGLR